MTASLNDIRSHFLNYFKGLDHEVVASAPLIPHNDPTLMFVNSGMVQFKNLFLGQEKRDYTRAVTAQKCVRAGGKHNDLDNVGYTARHHTFFEMLGNFSFGDYFKEAAIPYAWDLLTKEFELPKDKLYVTVYHTDDEAVKIWKAHAGLGDDRIIRIKTNDNFWMMGATGPCGPCTEIFYDHGDHIPGGLPGTPEEDGDRFIEIWNNVFMQNEQFDNGEMKPLKLQSIDTGMGLERMAALLQGSHDNYDTDLMRDLIETSANLTNGDPYGKMNVSHRVIADHLRSTAFLIADGVMPMNEGRGYVLRRIMRRAMRHAYLLGATAPTMYKMVPALVKQMGQAYPELVRGQRMIEDTLELEEKRFQATLERGMKLLDKEIDGLGAGKVLSGATAFNLYDTYGFPLDLTQDVLREKGLRVDGDGFDAAMDAQKSKARAAWAGSGDLADESVWFDIASEHGHTEFLGYELESSEAQILALVKDGAICKVAKTGEAIDIVVNQTPFYAESGGQVGDSGQMKTEHALAQITDTIKKAGVFIHRAKVQKGSLGVGDSAALSVDSARRGAIRSNHSATHLLHEALRQSLGDHVAQRGSLNDDTRLRFDFSHTTAMSTEQMNAVEDEVNRFIRQNSAVDTRIMTVDEARALGAQALFGEKYGDEVRVVAMGRQDKSGRGASGDIYSLELCGGTHVRQTGDIGLFVITGQAASSSGVRRIEATTGQAALDYVREKKDGLVAQVSVLTEEKKKKDKEISELKRKVAMGGGIQAFSEITSIQKINDINFVRQSLEGITSTDMRITVDDYKARDGSSVIVLISDIEGKAALVVGVTNDLTHRMSAVDIVNMASFAIGGKGGGGRPDLAQAGGGDASKAEDAFATVRDFLKKQKQ